MVSINKMLNNLHFSKEFKGQKIHFSNKISPEKIHFSNSKNANV